jgi:hypothetical protein
MFFSAAHPAPKVEYSFIDLPGLYQDANERSILLSQMMSAFLVMRNTLHAIRARCLAFMLTPFTAADRIV